MSKDIYVGVAGKARRVKEMYFGDGGVARKVRSAWVGDGDGKARLFYGVPYPPGVVTPDNMTTNTSPAPYRVSAMSEYSASYAALKAFNSTQGDSSWASGNTAFTGDTANSGECWIQIYLGGKKAATRVRWRTRTNGYGTLAQEQPKDFQILGSNDDAAWNDTITSDKWVLLGDFAGADAMAANTWSEPFVFTGVGYYRYYRMKITRRTGNVTDSGYVCIGEEE